MFKSLRLFAIDRKFLKKSDKDTTGAAYLIKRSAEGNIPVYFERKRKPDRSYEYVTKVGGLYGNGQAFACDVKNAIGAENVKLQRRKAIISGDANMVTKLKLWLHKSGF